MEDPANFEKDGKENVRVEFMHKLRGIICRYKRVYCTDYDVDFGGLIVCTYRYTIPKGMRDERLLLLHLFLLLQGLKEWVLACHVFRQDAEISDVLLFCLELATTTNQDEMSPQSDQTLPFHEIILLKQDKTNSFQDQEHGDGSRGKGDQPGLPLHLVHLGDVVALSQNILNTSSNAAQPAAVLSCWSGCAQNPWDRTSTLPIEGWQQMVHAVLPPYQCCCVHWGIQFCRIEAIHSIS
ncbi:hypothetical protein Anapl_17145 [Anas platyrhynchos]|uniref:Uncharacterized protein n=1 Tax=Anas platyrhynchos TaxID=8839 RepID=R0L3G8_ANAPL|nr:hypothetical protein Anapl_17145 [Anas platyrhynchos]